MNFLILINIEYNHNHQEFQENIPDTIDIIVIYQVVKEEIHIIFIKIEIVFNSLYAMNQILNNNFNKDTKIIIKI